MWRFIDIQEQASRSGFGAARMFRLANAQPSWIARTALGVGILVFTTVVLLLVVPAFFIAAAVFLALALVSHTVRSVRRMIGLDSSGRRNVRVIVRR